MRNQENIGIIVRGKHVVTNLLLFTKYLLSVNSSFIKGSKRHKNHYFLDCKTNVCVHSLSTIMSSFFKKYTNSDLKFAPYVRVHIKTKP